MTGHGRGSKPRPICARKQAYRSEDQAKHAVVQIRARGSEQRPYRCPFCGKWHLTSQPKNG